MMLPWVFAYLRGPKGVFKNLKKEQHCYIFRYLLKLGLNYGLICKTCPSTVVLIKNAHFSTLSVRLTRESADQVQKFQKRTALLHTQICWNWD